MYKVILMAFPDELLGTGWAVVCNIKGGNVEIITTDTPITGKCAWIL